MIILRRFLIAVVLGLTLAALGVACLRADRAPSDDLRNATAALHLARRAEASLYAPEAWHRAETEWKQAIALLAAENEKWRLRRRYDGVRTAAQRALVGGHTAASAAEASRDSLLTGVEDNLRATSAALRVLEPALRALPSTEPERTTLIQIRAAQGLAERARDRKDVLSASASAREALQGTQALTRRTQQTLRAYVSDLPTWQGWVDAAVARSRASQTPLLVVDKMQRRLVLYERGIVAARFPIELGPNWIGPKRWEGDEATPEGLYRITHILGPGQTIFTRALAFNYPNAEDRRRFASDQQSGLAPRGASIGGNLEIHGRGGRGVDWTRGCIALDDADVKRLARRVPVGTPLVIVGTLDVPAVYRDVLDVRIVPSPTSTAM